MATIDGKRIHRSMRVRANSPKSAKNKVKRKVGVKYTVYSSKLVSKVGRRGMATYEVGYILKKYMPRRVR